MKLAYWPLMGGLQAATRPGSSSLYQM